jgi:hypothetical protein
MIENNGCALSSFDQDEWARLGDYVAWRASDALQLFRLLREANVRMLGRLSSDEMGAIGLARGTGQDHRAWEREHVEKVE